MTVTINGSDTVAAHANFKPFTLEAVSDMISPSVAKDYFDTARIVFGRAGADDGVELLVSFRSRPDIAGNPLELFVTGQVSGETFDWADLVDRKYVI